MFNWVSGVRTRWTLTRVEAKGRTVVVRQCYGAVTKKGSRRNFTATRKTSTLSAWRQPSASRKRPGKRSDAAETVGNTHATESDFAQVFGGWGTNDAIPLCAHWPSFVCGELDRDHSIWAHRRKAGERTNIYPANPQVCNADLEPACKAKSAVVAGNRVKVGGFAASGLTSSIPE